MTTDAPGTARRRPGRETGSAVPRPGPHGGDGARYAAALGMDPADVLDLSASLNPLAPDSGAVLRRHLDRLDTYPDDGDATTALAEAMGVDAERLVLTNGGAEAIALVARLRPVGWVEDPEFSLYARHLERIDPTAPRWRSDPHNPTGALAAPDTATTDSVRDEAFYLLATGRWTRGDTERPRSPAGTVAGSTDQRVSPIVVGSLTKAWSLPGLRIGYVLTTDPADADAARRLRPRWSVNGLVCHALGDLLTLADPTAWRDGIADLRADLTGLLDAHGFVAAPSDVNYVWVPDAPGLRDRLLAHGIVVRDGSSFGAPDAVRIAVPDSAGLDRLAAAFSTIPDHGEPL